MSNLSDDVRHADEGEPTWEIAKLFPVQGSWSPEEYLRLSGNRLVEFNEGFVEILPMPTLTYQLIVQFLYRSLRQFVVDRGVETVVVAPYRIKTVVNRFREPEVVFLANERAAQVGEVFADGADLVMEVVAVDDPARDLDLKRVEYAEAGIPEYWIVDPFEGRIIVLVLEPGSSTYQEYKNFQRSEQASSELLSGFEVSVTEALAAAP